MATAGVEEVTEHAIRAVARDCGSLSIECSDVAGYVEGVALRITGHTKTLDALEDITDRLLAVGAINGGGLVPGRSATDRVNPITPPVGATSGTGTVIITGEVPR